MTVCFEQKNNGSRGGGEGGTWASTFFLICAAGLMEFLT